MVKIREFQNLSVYAWVTLKCSPFLVSMVWFFVLLGNRSFKIPSSIPDLANLSDIVFLLVSSFSKRKTSTA